MKKNYILLTVATCFFLGLFSCNKNDASTNPGPAPTPDPRAEDIGNYHFMIRVLTYTSPNWVMTEDTVYYNGNIHADPNSADSVIIQYDSIPAHNVITMVDSTDSFWVNGIGGPSPGALNSSGAIAFQQCVRFDTAVHVWHNVTGQRY